MINCHLDPKASTVGLFVGLYARNKGEFSPLVEEGAEPKYTNLYGTDIPAAWDEKAAAWKAPKSILELADEPSGTNLEEGPGAAS